MATGHSLALPLSVQYAHNTREGFSLFRSSGSGAPSHDSDMTLVDRYLDDLCAFLRSARLIQSHPDNYFQLIRGETWAGSSVLFDNSPVEPEELARTRALLSCFRPLLQGEGAMSKLRELVRDGPPKGAEKHTAASGGEVSASLASQTLVSPSPLQEFYMATRRLMLGRARRPKNDAASLTLLSEAERQAIDRDSSSAQAQRQHEKDILDLVVSRGMNPKKQHEVRIMRETIRDLVQCCNAGVEHTHAAPLRAEETGNASWATERHPRGNVARVRTVINIGEGKGYVSRAVALCDDLQVVGLDCNPAHKECAVDRFESLLEAGLSSRDGRPRINLLYEPHGHMVSIACRVGEKADWKSLLHGHLRTCADPCSAISRSCSDEGCATAGSAEEAQVAIGEDNAVALTRARGDETVKLACRVCGKVVRRESTNVIMKHIYGHLHAHSGRGPVSSEVRTVAGAAEPSELPQSRLLRIPTLAEAQQWNVTLPQHAYVAKLTELFFTVSDIESQHFSNRKDVALLKRVRVGDEGDAALQASTSEVTRGYLTLAPQVSNDAWSGTSGAQRQPPTPERSHVTLEPAHTARGYRAVLLMAVVESRASGEVSVHSPLSPHSPAAGEEQRVVVTPAAYERDAEPCSTSPTPVQRQHLWTYTQVIATIVGYDGGADSHHVYLDNESERRTLRLYRLPADATGAAQGGALQLTGRHSGDIDCMGRWRLPDAETWGRERVALVLSVLTPTLPSTPNVYVPSVRNTALIGLHSCGDLGSNVCRIFRNSLARGLLLVSCCWHALTPHGFPLSHSLKRRGLTTTSVSFLLATQPLDAWSAASPEGHRSSAKLLFFRSLFKLLWTQLAREWEAGQKDGSLPPPAGCTHAGHMSGGGTCAFPQAPPHLGPAFLRRVSRDKDTLTFAQFVHSVASEYVYAESARDASSTPWGGVGQSCAACRAAQEAFTRDALAQRRLPETMGARLEQEHFASFLGLTVLRMWMCHLVESLLLLDRTLYLHEALSTPDSYAAGAPAAEAESSAVALVPLFDGALSPRMYAVLARRGGSACG
ncbi:hypothetical protein LSCM1_05611 [Leishmania martiniquensis]|uniref:Methyltransferase domain-containing protein n=1 Tax=Leishmania martiniquensis TaxID=1580590 RepID=A0A836GGG7_9TRYP|nr:hypothetical protein LSCM1_05611 [Leishmania martiniquensis]